MTRDLIRCGSREFTAVLHFTKTVRRLYHYSLCVKNFCCPHWEKFSEKVTQGVILLLGAITRHPWRCNAMLHLLIVITYYKFYISFHLIFALWQFYTLVAEAIHATCQQGIEA